MLLASWFEAPPPELPVFACQLSTTPKYLGLLFLKSMKGFPIKSKIYVYTAALDLCLEDIEDLGGHLSAYEVSRRVSKYPECKQAIKIRKDRCDLIPLVQASGLFPLAVLRATAAKSLLPGYRSSTGLSEAGLGFFATDIQA
ncbi:hypothetical protein RF11_06464 [Thelohanellus kitauei]|uniref:Uncharacterized protein n=1 Tax=Thelohanellus kitauei TaxID=669202 RepID=A0A0C2M2J6_THEKT|nr:hypothetical protein RF11_06464 [Thelohanellus kitauei]